MLLIFQTLLILPRSPSNAANLIDREQLEIFCGEYVLCKICNTKDRHPSGHRNGLRVVGVWLYTPSRATLLFLYISIISIRKCLANPLTDFLEDPRMFSRL